MNHPIVPALVGFVSFVMAAAGFTSVRAGVGVRANDPARTGDRDRAGGAGTLAARASTAMPRRIRHRATPASLLRATAAWSDDLARRLRSGDSLRAALQAAVPNEPAVAASVEAMRRSLRLGNDLDVAVDLLGSAGLRRDATVPIDLVAATLHVAAAVGTLPAAALDRVGGVLRLRAADLEERAAHSAQARLSARVLTIVPVAMLILLTVADRGVRTALTTPLGAGCVIAGLALNAAGGRWMRSTIDADRRGTGSDVSDAIDLLVLGIQAGVSPSQAVHDLADHAPLRLRPAFGAVVHRTRRDIAFPDALQAMVDLLGSEATAAVEVLAATERQGLPIVPALDDLSREARAIRRRDDEAAARRLGVRLAFPLVVCTLPSFVLLAIAPAVIAAVSSLAVPR